MIHGSLLAVILVTPIDAALPPDAGQPRHRKTVAVRETEPLLPQAMAVGDVTVPAPLPERSHARRAEARRGTDREIRDLLLGKADDATRDLPLPATIMGIRHPQIVNKAP